MTNSLDERAMVASTKSASDSAAGDTIYAIYDALGSLKGELAYIAGSYSANANVHSVILVTAGIPWGNPRGVTG